MNEMLTSHDMLNCLPVPVHDVDIAPVWVMSGFHPYCFECPLDSAAHVVEVGKESVVPGSVYVQHSATTFSTSQQRAP